jgi:hypothetical protein
MEAQIYLEQCVSEAKIFMNKTTAYRRDFDSMFENAASQDEVYRIIDEFDDEQLRKYFESSQVLIDSQVLFQKISSFIYFSKILQIELDLSILNEVNGLLDFVSNYKPFETSAVLTSEGQLQEKNKKIEDKKFEQFKANLKKTRNIINEA